MKTGYRCIRFQEAQQRWSGDTALSCRMSGVLDPAAGSVGGGLAGGQLQAWPAGSCVGVLGWRGDSVMVGACGASAQC
jgi:hypothetical protein